MSQAGPVSKSQVGQASFDHQRLRYRCKGALERQAARNEPGPVSECRVKVGPLLDLCLMEM